MIIIIAYYFSCFISNYVQERARPARSLVLAGLDKLLRFIAYLSLVKLSCTTKLTVGKVILVIILARLCMEGGH